MIDFFEDLIIGPRVSLDSPEATVWDKPKA